MYFLEQRSQDDVAAALGTTRSNVSRMLKRARDVGIVEIRIVHPAQRDHELEQALRRRFHLTDARVLTVGVDTDVLSAVGRLAARWLRESLRDGQVVALSWGNTLHAVVQAVEGAFLPSVEVVPLVGGLWALDSNVSGQELVRELSERLGAHQRYLHAPALFDSADALAMMLREPSIVAALDAARAADIALVGIGASGLGSSAAIIEALALSAREQADFTDSGAVGDVCARFFDLTGTEVATAVADRILAVGLDDLRAIPTVAGIAVGQEKAAGILGSLRGGLIDVLVCDGRAARRVLDLDRGRGP
jgi:DNA-binding transcriptional regulator LsrR (DeoR family)